MLGETKEPGRMLLAYLSRSGDTQVIAGQLNVRSLPISSRYALRLCGPRRWSPGLHGFERTLPRLAVSEIGKYNVVPNLVIGSSEPVCTFLTTHDLSGKTLAPFFTEAPSLFLALFSGGR
jgi:hypothetical protein